MLNLQCGDISVASRAALKDEVESPSSKNVSVPVGLSGSLGVKKRRWTFFQFIARAIFPRSRAFQPNEKLSPASFSVRPRKEKQEPVKVPPSCADCSEVKPWGGSTRKVQHMPN